MVEKTNHQAVASFNHTQQQLETAWVIESLAVNQLRFNDNSSALAPCNLHAFLGGAGDISSHYCCLWFYHHFFLSITGDRWLRWSSHGSMVWLVYCKWLVDNHGYKQPIWINGITWYNMVYHHRFLSNHHCWSLLNWCSTWMIIPLIDGNPQNPGRSCMVPNHWAVVWSPRDGGTGHSGTAPPWERWAAEHAAPLSHPGGPHWEWRSPSSWWWRIEDNTQQFDGLIVDNDDFKRVITLFIMVNRG